jgi:histidinol-phosphate aminotransferase
MTSDITNLTRRAWLAGASATGLALSAHAAVATPPSIARLSLNENPFGPSPKALAAIERAVGQVARYVGEDARALGQQIAALEGVTPIQIVLGEILDSLGLQLALAGGPGGEFIYSEPGYTALVDAVAPGGGIVVGVPLNAQLENDLPAIAARIGPRTRAVYLVNPHNPTGTVSDAETFRRFVQQISTRTLVIVDEAYLEFDDDFGGRTVVGLTQASANVVVFRTFGKMYGLAGLSIGYAVAPKPLAVSLRAKGLGNSHAQNCLAVAAASASLADAGYVDTTRRAVAEERRIWHALLDRLRLRRSHAHGNFVFFKTGRPHDAFAADMLARGVEVSRAFAPLDDWVRISIGLPDENRRAQDAMRALLG